VPIGKNARLLVVGFLETQRLLIEVAQEAGLLETEAGRDQHDRKVHKRMVGRYNVLLCSSVLEF
jgi:hypothetical protein